MKTVKFILAVGLAFCMLFATTGCAELVQILQNYGADFYMGNGSGDYSSSSTAEAQIATADTRLYPDLPAEDYGGYNFRILADSKYDDPTNSYNDIFVEA